MSATPAQRFGALGRLLVLNDEPLFGKDAPFQADLDVFNHAAFAAALLKLLKENAPPLSVGLFGRWGIGKSTVINILFRWISESESTSFKQIYFNAWKYSGDSFRRQFLIEVAKQIYGSASHPQVKRLEQLNYTEVLRDEPERKWWEDLKDALLARVKFRQEGLARVILGATVVLIGAVVGIVSKSVWPLLTSAIPGLLISFLGIKFDQVFVVQERAVFDPKLIFPEQFEAEFRKLVSPDGPLGAKKAVIAIDDIDRCEPTTIKDILISTKNFVGHQNCFFIIPCDDSAVVKVFDEDANQQAGYREELLRKYFNVGVRIPQINTTDLVDFANSVARASGIPDEVVQIAVMANCRDARKMKHFLNGLSVKYQVAKAREQAGLLPDVVDNNILQLAKAVLIEDLSPDLFNKILQNPRVYDALERAALGEEVTTQLQELGLAEWEKQFPTLKGILQKTRHIRMKDLELLLSLKSTNPEARLPRGGQVKAAIVEGDATVLAAAVDDITEPIQKIALADLLLDLLDKTREAFLRNTVTAALGLYTKPEFFDSADKPRLAGKISYALAYDKAVAPRLVILVGHRTVLPRRLPDTFIKARLADASLLFHTPTQPHTELLSLHVPWQKNRIGTSTRTASPGCAGELCLRMPTRLAGYH